MRDKKYHGFSYYRRHCRNPLGEPSPGLVKCASEVTGIDPFKLSVMPKYKVMALFDAARKKRDIARGKKLPAPPKDPLQKGACRKYGVDPSVKTYIDPERAAGAGRTG